MYGNKIKQKLIKPKGIEVKLATRKNGYRGGKTNDTNTIFVGERIHNPIEAVSNLSYESIRIACIGEDVHFHPLIYCNPIAQHLKGCLGLGPKDAFINLYGMKAYLKWQKQIIYWRRSHPTKVKEYAQKSSIKYRQKLNAKKKEDLAKGGE